MSAPTDICGECGTRQRVTGKNRIYKHGECPGGGQEPPKVDPRFRKTGYTDEDLHEMLHNLTPKRQKLRERIVARWHRFKKNLDDYFDGGWDVYDD